MKISQTSMLLASSALGLVMSLSAAYAQDDDSEDRIVVTGSRVVRDVTTAPTPLTSVSSEALNEIAPDSLPDALNKLPQFTNSDNNYSAATFQGGTSLTGNYLNLRSLDSDRVLVLLDGNRVPPSHRTNAVDSNMLPQMLVERVEVVTGGASAVYGSDAVTGVVNYILDDDFEGIKGRVQSGLSTYGDAFSLRYGLAVGKSFADDRMHFLASYERYDSNGIETYADRPDWAPNSPTQIGFGTAAFPYTTNPAPRFNNISYGGLIIGGGAGLDGMIVQPDGSLVPYEAGLPTTSNSADTGGDGVIWPSGERNHPTAYSTQTSVPISLDVATHQAFSRLTFDLSDSVEMYVQGIFGMSNVDGNTSIPNSRASTSRRTITIYDDNPYLSDDVRNTLMMNGEESFKLSRFWNDIRPNEQHQETEFRVFSGGFKGELPNNWRWDVNYSNGRSVYDFAAIEFNSRRYYAAIDAVRDTDGTIVCGVTLRRPGFLDDCIPVNVLGEGNPSTEAIDWMYGSSEHSIVNKMEIVSGNLSGELFDLPAGAVGFAFGGEYRTQSLEQTTNSDPGFLDDPAVRAGWFGGIRGVSSTAPIFQVTNVGVSSGTQKVKEVYGEILVPLLSDQALAESLEFSAAGRWTDYKTSGSVWTYKFGGSWIPVDGARVRATYSRDIAAPSLNDLFAQGNFRQSGFEDIHTMFTGVTNIATTGNPDLNPEFGKTISVGIVLTPPSIPGLAVAVDAYNIKIDGAIRTTNESDIVQTCEDSGGTDPACDLVQRPFPFSDTSVANYPTVITVAPLNLAVLETSGIDFEVGYTFPLDDLLPSLGGTVDLRGYATYVHKYDTQGEVGGVLTKRAGRVDGDLGIPKWKGLLRQSYMNGPLTVSLSERFTGSYKLSSPSEIADPVIYDPVELGTAPNQIYVDMNLAYRLGADEQYQLFLNIQNLLDNDPPYTIGGNAGNLALRTDRRTYDVRGRYFTAGLRFEF